MTDFARMDTHGWELESAVRRHASAPGTFWIPPEEQRDTLRVGQAAKLIFRIRVVDERGEAEVVTERMWVSVTARVGGGYEGRLQNQPQSTRDLRPGTVVRFRPEHVADVDDPPPGYQPL